jgi:alpha 1,6-mannosyltransferase
MKKRGTLKRFKGNNVIEFTGPAVWTDMIFDYMNDERYFDLSTGNGNITWRDFTGMKTPKKVGDVVILPITSFSPGVGQMGAEDYDHPMAFVKHDFEGNSPSHNSLNSVSNNNLGTWKPESERHIGEEKQEEKPEEKQEEKKQ